MKGTGQTAKGSAVADGARGAADLRTGSYSTGGADVGGVSGDGADGESKTHGRLHGRGRGEVSVITEARPSYDDEFRARRKRYVIMMLMRLPCLILAAALYHTPWLAVLIILVSIPLPWMAVLIANDGPARKQRRVPRGVVNSQRALTAGGAATVVDESASSWSDRHHSAGAE